MVTKNNKKEIKDEVEELEIPEGLEGRLDQLKIYIGRARHTLDKIERITQKIEQDKRKQMYKKMPGIEGMFDGTHLISESGEKVEVPANYAAKSRLCYGDVLKVIDDNGRQVFKQISKVERQKVDGVLSKKEGVWYVLTDKGTFKISNVAAEFNDAKLKDKVSVYIPENAKNVPFAALDKIIRDAEEEKEAAPKKEKKETKKPEKKKIEPKEDKKKPEKAPKEEKETKEVKKTSEKEEKPKKKVAPKKEKKTEKKTDKKGYEGSIKKEFVANILDDDDLI